jgi:hypothetical protein
VEESTIPVFGVEDKVFFVYAKQGAVAHGSGPTNDECRKQPDVQPAGGFG